jgi:hypothetical protein
MGGLILGVVECAFVHGASLTLELAVCASWSSATESPGRNAAGDQFGELDGSSLGDTSTWTASS